jgi:hypothetical protein
MKFMRPIIFTVFAIMLTIPSYVSADIFSLSMRKVYKDELKNPLFNEGGIKIFGAVEPCILGSNYLRVFTDVALPKDILGSSQFTGGPINEAYVGLLKRCGFYGKQAGHLSSMIVALYITDASYPYGGGDIRTSNTRITSNLDLQTYSGKPNPENDKDKLLEIISVINSSGKTGHVYASVEDHLSKQTSTMLREFCKKAPTANTGHTPTWENDTCIIKTSSTDTYLYHWSAESRVTACRDDSSSCEYEFQIICNSSLWDGKKAYCRDFPVQKGTIKLQ